MDGSLLSRRNRERGTAIGSDHVHTLCPPGRNTPPHLHRPPSRCTALAQPKVTPPPHPTPSHRRTPPIRRCSVGAGESNSSTTPQELQRHVCKHVGVEEETEVA